MLTLPGTKQTGWTNTNGSFGGREASIEQKAKEGASTVKDTASKGVETVKGAAKDVKAKVSSS
jgi:hypothetical protein